MRPATLAVAMLCIGLAGCARLREFFPEPTVWPVTASPDLLTYEYSRLYGNDFPRAVAAAERQCMHYDKRAQVVSLVAKDADRAWAIFACR